MNKLPELVIFDMDGVIIDSERVAILAYKQALEEFGYPNNIELINQFTGKSRKNNIALLNQLYGGDSQGMFDRMSEVFFELLDQEPVQLKKGFNELYSFFKQNHIPMCIASSSRNSTIQKHLVSTHLENAFDHIFSGEDIQNGKPDPEIFLNACKYFHVEVENALVIEDSENGIKAGFNAHIPTIGIVDTIYHSREIMNMCVAMVADLDHIIQLYTSPELVLFDMDGLLVDTEMLCLDPFRQAHLKYGYTISDETLHALIGTSGKVLERILRDTYDASYPFEKVMEAADEFMLEEVKKNLPVKSGAHQLLQYYYDKQIPCIVASSSPRSTLELYIEKANFHGMFQDIVCIDDVKASKPEPDIFLKGLEKMGIKGKNALVIEDSKNGIIAANKAGIPVICVPDLIYHPQEIFELSLAFTSSLDKITYFK